MTCLNRPTSTLVFVMGVLSLLVPFLAGFVPLFCSGSRRVLVGKGAIAAGSSDAICHNENNHRYGDMSCSANDMSRADSGSRNELQRVLLLDSSPDDYIDSELQYLVLTDISSEVLFGELSSALDVQYLSLSRAADEKPPDPDLVEGLVWGVNSRLMVNLVCSIGGRASQRRTYHKYNVFFLVDTGSPFTYVSAEAMENKRERRTPTPSHAIKFSVRGSSVPKQSGLLTRNFRM